MFDEKFKKSNPEITNAVEPSLYFLYYKCLNEDVNTSIKTKRLYPILQLGELSHQFASKKILEETKGEVKIEISAILLFDHMIQISLQ